MVINMWWKDGAVTIAKTHNCYFDMNRREFCLVRIKLDGLAD